MFVLWIGIMPGGRIGTRNGQRVVSGLFSMNLKTEPDNQYDKYPPNIRVYGRFP